MYKKINSCFLIFIILFSMFPVKADAPIKYYEIDSDIELRGAIFVDVDPDSFYASLNNGVIQIDSFIDYNDVTIKFKGTALNSRLKKYNGFNIGYTHISHNGIITNELKLLKIDYQGFAYLNTDFSTVIINGMTGITTTILNEFSGNQSISVPDGSSYDLNITNNHPGIWASSDGRNYQNKSIVTINGSMVTTETGIPLQLFTNHEGVNGTGDIGIAYTNLTAIPREIEYIWDSDNVSLYFPFNTISGVDSEFVVLWGSDNNTEPVTDSTYGSQAVYDSNYKAVYHMNYEPNGAGVNTLLDSTSNNLHQSPNGFIVNSLVDGEYGKGIKFDDTNDYFNRLASLVSNDKWNILIQHKTGADITNLHNLISATQATQYYLAHHLCIYNGYHASYTSPAWFYAPTALSTNTEYIATFDYAVIGTLDYYLNGVLTGSDSVDSAQDNMEILTIGAYHDGTRLYNGNIYEIRYSNIERTSNYTITTQKNLNNPTACDTNSFYKSIGSTQTASGIINITASVTGDLNEQSYNTSQTREFTLTPTGTSNNVLINTTSTDYNVIVTTYWTDDTTQYSQTSDYGYVKSYINYTPLFDIDTAIFNDTINLGIHNFSNDDYIGNINVSINNSYIIGIRNNQEINATAYNLIKDIEYLINFTIPYNNIFTLSNQSDTTAYLGISKQFNDSNYNDPDNNPILSRLWNFGDNNNINISNPTHTYNSLGIFNANYTITENATTNSQTITKEFNVTVEVQSPQNVTTIPHQSNVSINWDDYAYADKYSVYELEDGFSYVNINPVVDGVKDVVYNYAHEFLIFSPNPIIHGDYGTIYPVRTALGAYLLIESIDNDNKLGDDDTIYYFDLDNDGLTINDPAWKITNNIVKKYLWNGNSWAVTGSTNAVGDSTGGGTHYPIHELFIPIAELGSNWTNGSTIKVLVKREDSALSPDVITWYPYGNINNTDTNLWQEMVLNDPESYNLLANVTLSNYTALNLTPFTIYHAAVSSWNGTIESDYTLFDVITEDIPFYSVSGYVFDDLGNTIAGAVVHSCNAFIHEITQTNIYGYWIGYNFREGNYTICANKSGYQENFTNIHVSTNMTNINVTLPAYIITDWEIYQQLLLLESQNDEILLNNIIVNDKLDTILIFILLNMAVIVGVIIGKRGKDNDN